MSFLQVLLSKIQDKDLGQLLEKDQLKRAQRDKQAFCGFSKILSRIVWLGLAKNIYELSCEKTCLLMCASNEDSDRPAHPRSLNRVFFVRMKKSCNLGYPKSAQ